MSRQQWGHGYRAGLRDGMKQPRKEWWETKQEEARDKIWRLLNSDISRAEWDYIDTGIASLSDCTLLIPCPFHYALSTWTGRLFQVQSKSCLVKTQATILDDVSNFPFHSDCGWYGTVFSLWSALEEVEASIDEMRREETLSYDLKYDFSETHHGHFIELRLPETEAAKKRGWAPRTVIAEERWRWEKA